MMTLKNRKKVEAYRDNDNNDDIDDLFGMIEDEDSDSDEFEEGDLELGNLILGNNLQIDNTPTQKSLSKSKTPVPIATEKRTTNISSRATTIITIRF